MKSIKNLLRDRECASAQRKASSPPDANRPHSEIASMTGCGRSPNGHSSEAATVGVDKTVNRHLSGGGSANGAVSVVQIPGCLPKGFDLDSLLTVEQFAIWQQVAESTARASVASMKGVVRRSREWVRIHPRTFLAGSIKSR